MKQRYTLYVREHHTGWFTMSVLTQPTYAAYGPAPSRLRDELIEVLEEDLASGTLSPDGEHALEDLERRSLDVPLKAVQHDRLITVPMRFSLLVRRVAPKSDVFEVHVPRLHEKFRIQGEENIAPWAEEVIRGHFHLKEVTTLLAYQYERAERLETIDVNVGGKAKLKKERGERPEPPNPALHPLARFGAELVGEAKEGRLPRASFRDSVVDVLSGVLVSKRTPSGILVGPSGSGKTAIVQELAHRIAAGQAGARLEGTSVWHITGMRMVAGTRWLGEWQARVAQIIASLTASRDILYVGNLLELVTSERERSGLTVAQFLLSVIQSGELSVVAEATPDALAAAEALDGQFVRAFQRIPVPPLPVEHTTALLTRAADRLAREHRLRWAPGAASSALDVVARFGDAEALPGSGLQLLEEMVRLSSEEVTARKATPAPGAPGAVKKGAEREILPGQAVRAFARSSGFPEALLDPSTRLDVAEVRRFFAERVIGQDHALELLSNVILLLKAGLNDPQKPLGSFLFMGPTGVGKTESALTLAEWLFRDRKRLVRFDLSEYGYPGAAVRLVDGPGGQGELTRAVRERPFSVLLFDEVEKADPGVFDVLLQVLGEGRLTDGTGRTVRFTHTIVILTSNLGAKVKPPVGFEDGAPAGRLERHYLDAAAKFFRPELLNRLDHLVPFGELTAETIRTIAVRLLDAALEREGLTRRKITVEREPAVLDVLAKVGFDPKYGARPMKRAVESQVTVPLAKLLMTWPEDTPGALRLSADGDTLTLSRR